MTFESNLVANGVLRIERSVEAALAARRSRWRWRVDELRRRRRLERRTHICIDAQRRCRREQQARTRAERAHGALPGVIAIAELMIDSLEGNVIVTATYAQLEVVHERERGLHKRTDGTDFIQLILAQCIVGLSC